MQRNDQVRNERTKNGNEIILTKSYENDRLDMISRQINCTDINKMPLDLAYLSFDNAPRFGGKRADGKTTQRVSLRYIRDKDIVAHIEGSDKKKLYVLKSLSLVEATVLGKSFQRSIEQINIDRKFLTGLRQLLIVRKTSLKLLIIPRQDEIKFNSAFRYSCLTELVLPYCLNDWKEANKYPTLRMIERLPNLKNLENWPTTYSALIKTTYYNYLFFNLTVINGTESDTDSNSIDAKNDSHILEMFRLKFDHEVKVYNRVESIKKEEALFFYHQICSLGNLGVIKDVKINCWEIKKLKFLDLNSKISVNFL